jgi:hypothetical protein
MRGFWSFGAITFIVGCAGTDSMGTSPGPSQGGIGGQPGGSAGVPTGAAAAGEAASAGSSATGGAGGTADSTATQHMADASAPEEIFTGVSALSSFGTNDACLPPGVSLPTAAGDSTAKCRVILMGVEGGCTQLGLSPAAAQDREAIVDHAMSPLLMSLPESVCQVEQIGVHTGGACAATDMSGWCYVDGACAEFTGDYHCDHAVCATGVLNHLMLRSALPNWLVCDAP